MEWRLFEAGTIPEYATAEWYEGREAAPHLEQEGHHDRLVVAAKFVADALISGGSTVCDLGAGDGGLLQQVRTEVGDDWLTMWGYDLQPTNVEAARHRGEQVMLADFNVDPVTMGDIVVACEVLEHLVDPQATVRRIADEGVDFLVASSPYTETPDAHYDFHLWAWDTPGYREMLEANGWVVKQTAHAWICQVVLCERAS